MTKKEWQQPTILLLNSKNIESGGGASSRWEQFRFNNSLGCGKTGTVIGTVVGTDQKVNICRTGACFLGTVYLSANGTRGKGSFASFGLCS